MARSNRKHLLHRQPGKKKPRSVTLIVCEGETEQIYLRVLIKHLGLSTAEVVIADDGDGPAPITVVKHAIRKYEENPIYDNVFCVIDRDGHGSYYDALWKIKTFAARNRNSIPITAIPSIPCFEIWVLMHFEKRAAPFNKCNEVIRRINHHQAGYTKTDVRISQNLMPKLADAKANAHWLEQQAEQNNHNPYTSMHHLVAHLENMRAENV